MSAAAQGVPVKVLHEAEGHIVTIETRTGDIFHGRLEEVEDSMNARLSAVTMRRPDGERLPLGHAYIRGSSIVYFILPDILKQAPMFKRMEQDGNIGLGIGKGRGVAMGRGGFRGGRGGGDRGGRGGGFRGGR
eukprot:c21242_g1_i1.p2 GENE.c21242_g1_i1~~c21242_g1_i1.p2  ORF type:complete len:145 (+),score=18.93 c21242_g1_i1:38-436(+)